MNIDKIQLGNFPEEFNVIIEIQKGGVPIKYEIDKNSGALEVDRFVLTPMQYPCNYACLPQTLGNDGDPIDALVITDHTLIPGSIIKVRPVGVLLMEDESGIDEKILTVPVSKITSLYDDIKTYKDLPGLQLQQIKYFFEHYKDLEKNKWVKIQGFESIEKAKDLINQGVIRATQK